MIYFICVQMSVLFDVNIIVFGISAIVWEGLRNSYSQTGLCVLLTCSEVRIMIGRHSSPEDRIKNK